MSASPREVVATLLAAAARGDFDAVRALLHPEVVVTEAGSLPFGGRHHGIEAFLALQRRVFTLWRETGIEVTTTVAEGEYVVVLAVMRGMARGGDGRLEMPIAEVWRVQRGLVVEVAPFYQDTHAFLQLLHGTSG